MVFVLHTEHTENWALQFSDHCQIRRNKNGIFPHKNMKAKWLRPQYRREINFYKNRKIGKIGLCATSMHCKYASDAVELP